MAEIGAIAPNWATVRVLFGPGQLAQVIDPGGGGGGGDTPPPGDPGDGGDMPPSDGGDTGGDTPPAQQPPDGSMPGPGEPPVQPSPPDEPPATPPEQPPDAGEPPPTGQPPAGEPPPPEAPAPGAPQPAPAPGAPGSPPPAPPIALPGLNDLMQWLRDRIQDIQTQLATVVDSLGADVKAVLESLLPTEIDAILEFAGVIGTFVQGLLDSLGTDVDITNTILDGIKARWQDTIVPLQTILANTLPQATDAVGHWIWDTRGGELNDLLGMIADIDGMPDEIRQVIHTARAGTPLALIPLAIGAAVVVIHSLVSSGASSLIRGVQQGSNRANPNALLAPPEVAAAWRRGFFDKGPHDYLRGHGLDDSTTDVLLSLTETFLPWELIIDLYRRGFINDEGVLRSQLSKRGLGPEQQDMAIQLAQLLPTTTDLVHFLTRDAFFDYDASPVGNIVAKFGMDQEYPAETADPWFDKIGIGPDLRKLHWRSHWELPGVQAGYEMYQRTVDSALDEDADAIDIPDGGTVYNVIGQASLDRLFRAKGIEPWWRDKLRAIAYRPFTRVDLRRLHKLGLSDRPGLIRGYLDIGYDIHHATVLADFAIALNGQESEAEKEPFRAPLKGHVIAKYLDATLSEADARKMLSDLGYHDEAVDAFISESVFLLESSKADAIRAGVRRLYTGRRWSIDRARQSLADHNFAEAEIGRLLDMWSLDREFSDLTAEERDNRALTKSEISQAFEARLISQEEATAMVAALGYDDSESATIISLAAYRRDKAQQTTIKDAIRAEYTAGLIDRTQASNELDANGIVAVAREALLTQWDASMRHKASEIPLPMLATIAEKQIAPVDWVVAELKRRRFPDDQVDYLLELWGYIERNSEDKARAASADKAAREQRRQEAEARRVANETRAAAARAAANERRTAHEAIAAANQAEARARRDATDARRTAAEARQQEAAGRAATARATATARAGRPTVAQTLAAYKRAVIDRPTAMRQLLDRGQSPEAAEQALKVADTQIAARPTKQPPA